MKVTIIGAGMAGLAASDRLRQLGIQAHVYEARSVWGGHTHSDNRDGFVFDEGPHVSFTKDDAVRALFTAGAVDVEEFRARITNAFRGSWIPHPAQCHLHGQDPDLIARCIVDFVNAQKSPPPIANYADWCVASFGQTFAETFPFSYTRKYWTVEASEMSTDWVGARIYPPKLEDVVRGALMPVSGEGFHYLSTFRYPSQGGYQSFMRSMYHPESISCDKRVAKLDLSAKRVSFYDGSSANYDALISTMPLPDLIRAIVPGQAPKEVRDAAEKLLCSSLVLVDVAVRRSDLSDAHWFYVYDEDISFARGHYPHMLAPKNAPPGCGSIQLEVYHSKHRPLPCRAPELPQRVVRELVALKILRSESEVLWARHREIQYANVIFDHARAGALAILLPWLKSVGILLAGRYGEWNYAWTDDAVKSGWAAAEAAAALGAERPGSTP